MQLPSDLPSKGSRLLLLQLGNPGHHLWRGYPWPASSPGLWLDQPSLVVAGENLADTPIGDLECRQTCGCLDLGSPRPSFQVNSSLDFSSKKPIPSPSAGTRLLSKALHRAPYAASHHPHPRWCIQMVQPLPPILEPQTKIQDSSGKEPSRSWSPTPCQGSRHSLQQDWLHNYNNLF